MNAQRTLLRFALLAGILVLVFSLGVAVQGATQAAIPAPEKLLPDDTLVMVTAPDFAKARQIWQKLPQHQLWDDPAMKPFRDRFTAKWEEEFVQPLERELGVKFEDYTGLPQGQLTLALTQNGWQGQGDQPFGLLLLLDAKNKSKQLTRNLTELRKKWVDAGKVFRTEKIRGLDFTVLSLSSNDVPRTWRKLFPAAPQVQELGAEKAAPRAAPGSELVLGQVESLLIVGNSTKVVERVVIRLTGGAAPALEDLAAYQANHLALFRDAPLYAWVNARALFEGLGRQLEKKDNPEAPNPFDPNPAKLLGASGLLGLKTIALSFQLTDGGELAQLFLGVPEANRRGLFQMLAGEPKESSPPPFVPVDAVKYQRWRIDGQKTWAALQKMLADLSPTAVNTLNFLLDSANTYAQQKDPGFDIRKNLIGNLGDDAISYEKAPRDAGAAESRSGPALFLLGSPNPEQLAAALKSVLVYLSQQVGTPPEEREFLGRKIFSVPLMPLPLPIAGARAVGPRTLYYAASGGYVALTTDVSMLEEYLRSSESQTKALRETPGLTEAAQRVTGPGTYLFGYRNQVEAMRAAFESARKNPAANTNAAPAAAGLLPGLPGLPGAGVQQSLRRWMDYSLLPPFDAVSKYFSFQVYGGSVTVDGLTFKLFAPAPAGK